MIIYRQKPRRVGLGDAISDAVWAQAGSPVEFETWDISTLGPPDTASIRSQQLGGGWFAVVDKGKLISVIGPTTDAIPALQSAGLPVASPWHGADYELNVLSQKMWTGADKDKLATGQISTAQVQASLRSQMEAQGWDKAVLDKLFSGGPDPGMTIAQSVQQQTGTPDLRQNASTALAPKTYQTDYQQGATQSAQFAQSGAFNPANYQTGQFVPNVLHIPGGPALSSSSSIPGLSPSQSASGINLWWIAAAVAAVVLFVGRD